MFSRNKRRILNDLKKTYELYNVLYSLNKKIEYKDISLIILELYCKYTNQTMLEVQKKIGKIKLWN